MNEYWITFRIQDDAGYQKRYNGLMNAIHDNKTAGWPAPTSFWIIESSLEIDKLGRKLAAPLNEKTDMFLMRMLSRASARYFGNVEDLAILQSFLPYAKKL